MLWMICIKTQIHPNSLMICIHLFALYTEWPTTRKPKTCEVKELQLFWSGVHNTEEHWKVLMDMAENLDYDGVERGLITQLIRYQSLLQLKEQTPKTHSHSYNYKYNPTKWEWNIDWVLIRWCPTTKTISHTTKIIKINKFTHLCRGICIF